MKVTLTTGGALHYELGLAESLSQGGVYLEIIGGPELEGSPALHSPLVRFYNLHGSHDAGAPKWVKALRVLKVYARLAAYAARTDARLFHLQWPYKLAVVDRTVLNSYYKLLGKRLIFTAHNVDGDARDGTSNWIRRFSLRFLYRIVDHIIVHTPRMKAELIKDFAVPESKISVIPHGIMSAVPESGLTRLEARRRFVLGPSDQVVLFFGLITPYKGLEQLVQALGALKSSGKPFKLIIAGRVKECREYWDSVNRLIEQFKLGPDVIRDLRHIPDAEVECFFKAADVLVLPYRGIFQSGVLFLAYRFGLPVIATDVGSFKDDIIAGTTGFICKPDDPADLARTIEVYFGSQLFRELEARQKGIREYAAERYSWCNIARLTRDVYERVLQA